MRTKEEIEAMTKVGEKFVKEHPRSMFGDDNVKQFEIFKVIIRRYLKGETIDELYDFVNDAYGDKDDDYLHANAVVDWLDGGEELY